MITCCGKYLEETGFDTVFVENEVYDPEIVKSLMNGGHYVRRICGMAIISEVLQTLQMNQFASQRCENGFNEADKIVKKISAMITKSNSEFAITEWERLNIMTKSSEFEVSPTNGEKASNQFAFWNGFIKKNISCFVGSNSFSQRRKFAIAPLSCTTCFTTIVCV